ncbi:MULTISPECIES: hypothetical protein [Kitasatospora]|uniref:Secreted protein n=2 Tax=Kitasatospora TaxID=2063 RepID=A0ABT1IYB9_9ACTN|nr:hypothetical protein [Kitasatospora paracochleata]MCP2310149.1 hypothetical protein [Kitasatospora paracochleata]
MQPALSINRSTALAAAALVLILPLSAVSCSAAQKAIDCGNTALRISTDITQVGTAFNNADNDPAAAGRALQQLKTDLDQLGRNSGDADVSKAVTDLQNQVTALQKAADTNQAPDLKPLGDAAAKLTKACTG